MSRAATEPVVDGATFPLVALGASAGGLDALDRFFSSLGSVPEAAFVVVQHLAPEHRTMMDTLLARHTAMPVAVARDAEELRPGHVYVIPPGTTMTVEGVTVRIEPRPATGLTLPIDAFFESVALSGPRPAIGVVLSGTGSDGTRGAQTLAARGGWVLAQDPATAGFDGMPLNAIDTGLVDAVLAPEALAGHVRTLIDEGADHPGRIPLGDRGLDVVTADEAVQMLRSVIPLDFAQYKPATLLRRLERRMDATGCFDLKAYADHLAKHPDEVSTLRRELLIPVTRFFRDPEAFEALRDEALRPLLRRIADSEEQPLRVWIAGCATGQEAYSIAMLVHELAEEEGAAPELKVFATDVEPSYVEHASAGRYTARQMDEIPPASRERWFTPSAEGEWQVKPELRQSIVFSRHDLLSDAPFTHVDLVVCRNLLIYLKLPAQERAIRRLSYALKRGGVLFMGSSESPGAAAPDYEALDARQKLYRLTRRAPVLPPEDLLVGGPARARLWTPRTPVASGRRTGPGPALDRAARELLEHYAPPSLVVTPERELVHLFGEVKRFLRFSAGTASLDVLQLLCEPLMPVVATLLHAAVREGEPQRSGPVALPGGEGAAPSDRVRVTVRPVAGEGSTIEQVVISFESLAAPAGPAETAPDTDLAELSSRQVADLEQELALTRANLHDTIQDLGTANEELQATNEELMASNEELQSTNEELHSVNEELHTLNSEYQAKIVELNEANADLESLTQAPGIPLVFLDEELRLSRFTDAANRLFRFRADDVGRPLTDFSHGLAKPDLYDAIEQAARTRVTYREELRDRDGGWWLVTAVPHRTRDGDAARMVVSCIDVSGLRDVKRLQAVMDALPEHVAVLDRDGAIRMVNASWRAFAEGNGDAGCLGCGPGVNYLDVCRAAAGADPYARSALEGIGGVLDRTRAGFVMYYPCHSLDEERWFVMHASPLEGAGCVISHFDISGFVDPELVRAFESC